MSPAADPGPLSQVIQPTQQLYSCFPAHNPASV